MHFWQVWLEFFFFFENCSDCSDTKHQWCCEYFLSLTYIILMPMHHSFFFFFLDRLEWEKCFQLHYWIFQLTTSYGLHQIFFRNALADNGNNLSDLANKLFFFCFRAWMWMPLKKNSTPLKLILSALSSCFVKTSWNSILDSVWWSATAGWVGSLLCIVKNWQWIQWIRSTAENPGFFPAPKDEFSDYAHVFTAL